MAATVVRGGRRAGRGRTWEARGVIVASILALAVQRASASFTRESASFARRMLAPPQPESQLSYEDARASASGSGGTAAGKEELPPPRLCILDRFGVEGSGVSENEFLTRLDIAMADNMRIYKFLSYSRPLADRVFTPEHDTLFKGTDAAVIEETQGPLLSERPPVSDYAERWQYPYVSPPTYPYGPCAADLIAQSQAPASKWLMVSGRSRTYFISNNDKLGCLGRAVGAASSDKPTVLLMDDNPHSSQLNETLMQEWRDTGDTGFRRVFMMAKDSEVPCVHTMPMTLDTSYTARTSQLYTFAAAVRNAKLSPSHKNARVPVLAAWGARKGWTNGSPMAQELEGVLQSGMWEGLVERRTIPSPGYWPELSKYHFMLSPHGLGVQSPKFFEALLLYVIPITKRIPAFEDLVAYGYPMVLVDDWAEVTEENLERWWAELSPKLPAARWGVTNEGILSLLLGECGPAPAPTAGGAPAPAVPMSSLSARANALASLGATG